jgi:hypothetical protein
VGCTWLESSPEPSSASSCSRCRRPRSLAGRTGRRHGHRHDGCEDRGPAGVRELDHLADRRRVLHRRRLPAHRSGTPHRAAVRLVARQVLARPVLRHGADRPRPLPRHTVEHGPRRRRRLPDRPVARFGQRLTPIQRRVAEETGFLPLPDLGAGQHHHLGHVRHGYGRQPVGRGLRRRCRYRHLLGHLGAGRDRARTRRTHRYAMVHGQGLQAGPDEDPRGPRPRA